MEKYKRFTDMSISIPDHVDQTAETSAESHDHNDINPKNRPSI